MSVLHRRIMAHDGGYGPGADHHPYGTAETPMVMPLAIVDYANDQAVYGMAHPLVTTDGAVIAARSSRAAVIPHVGVTVPAGRP